MKKTYHTPNIRVVALRARIAMMAGSATASGLDGFSGYGGKSSGRSADSRSFGEFLDDEEM